MWMQSFEQYKTQLFRNGHFDVIASGQFECGLCSRDAFCDGAGGLQNVREFLATSQTASQLVITAEWTGASCNQVADAGKAQKSKGIGASGDTQARDFCETSGSN